VRRLVIQAFEARQAHLVALPTGPPEERFDLEAQKSSDTAGY
jgi:hypothetical protein